MYPPRPMSLRRLFLLLLPSLPLVTGCAAVNASRPAEVPVVASPQAEPSAEANAAPEVVVAQGGALFAQVVAASEESAEEAESAGGTSLAAADGAEDSEVEEGADETESAEAPLSDGNTFPRYTHDLTDEELAELWRNDLAALGSLSVGFAHAGRLVNPVQVPKDDSEDPAWLVVSPHAAFATKETVDYILTAIRAVKAQFPEAPPLRVNQISGPEGGWLRPHRSHQNGRDVDFGFYYPTVDPVRVRDRENYIDVAKNWALVKALITLTDVQLILVDKRVQKVLYEHALAAGEDKAWLDSLFGPTAIIRHARRHRDHFHVRFYNPRAQELGLRVAPLLAQRPEQNLTFHRIRRGDTLSAIAVRYGSSVREIKQANRMRSDFLRVGVVLRIPLRGPCNRCPVPPEPIVPPRMLPPPPDTVASTEEAGGSTLTAQP